VAAKTVSFICRSRVHYACKSECMETILYEFKTNKR